MKPKERRAKIFDIIRQEGRVSVDRLVVEYDTSAETIRRDLAKLSKSGKVQKIHGGAVLPNADEEGPYQKRLSENIKAKRDVAQLASKLISKGESLFINAGTSTLLFAEELFQLSELTIITNSTQIAKLISSVSNSNKVILLGGEYMAEGHQTGGSIALEQLNNYYVQHAVLACAAIDAELGVMAFDYNEALIAKAMLAQSENVIVLSDKSKFNRKAFYKMGELKQIDQLVCEAAPELDLRQAMKRNKVSVVC